MIREAEIVADNDLLEAAGRAAYLAALNAAQAYIFDVSGRVVKTHNGVHSELNRLARTEPRIDATYVSFLARAYKLKQSADYAMGSSVEVTVEETRRTVEVAKRFVAMIASLLEAEAS